MACHNSMHGNSVSMHGFTSTLLNVSRMPLKIAKEKEGCFTGRGLQKAMFEYKHQPVSEL